MSGQQDCERAAQAGQAALRSDWHRVGAGFSVRFEFARGRFDAEWSRLPTRRELKRVLPRYQQARQLFLREIAASIGGSVACVELSA